MDKRHKELIVFAVAIGVLALLAVMTLGKGKHPQTARKTKKPAVQVASNSRDVTGQPVTSPDADADDGDMVPLTGDIAGRSRQRDPFIPAVSVVEAAKPTQTPTVNPPKVPAVAMNMHGPPQLPNWPVFNTGEIRPANPGVVAPQPVREERIVLTGIIEGNPPVAVFRRSNKRFIVEPGDNFAGYRVVNIYGQSVALAQGNKHHSIPLGGQL
jgi:hypothetical protein